MRLLWPTLASMSGGRILCQDRSGLKRLYITFDDGPSPRHTPRLLEVLAKHHVPATFFMIGKHVVEEPVLVREIARLRHEMANHSMTHPHFDRISNRQRFEEIRSAERVLRAAGSESPLFRLPYGDDSPELVSFVLGSGCRLALWSRDSMDYKLGAAAVVEGFRQQPVQMGDVILFHDDGPVAAEALDELLPMWIAQGYGFARLSQLRVPTMWGMHRARAA